MKRRTHRAPRPRCKARTKRGQCKRAPIHGGAVCHTHGGAAPQVKNKAKERIREYVAEMVDPDRLLQEAARLSLSDIRELYDEDGRLLPVKKLPDNIAHAVKSVENVRGNVDKGDGHFDRVVKLTLTGKEKSLEMLFKHLGLLEERVEHSGGIDITWKDSE